MKLFVFGVFFVAVALHVTTVKSLKCYTCSSSKDWKSCNDNKKETTCKSAATRCVKAEAHINDGSIENSEYVKRCVKASECDTKVFPSCQYRANGKGVRVSINCKVSCCDRNLCNTGTVPLVSGLVVITCALLSMIDML